MDPKEKLTPAIKALQDLKVCYPEDSEQAKALDSLSLVVADMVIGGGQPGKNQELIKEFFGLSGQNAARRLKAAHARREIDDTMVELLDNNALLQNTVRQAKSQ